jgi:phosphohistidine phosphatase SixA
MYLYLVRHGLSTDRHQWDGPDHARPLTETGVEQMRAEAAALTARKNPTVEAIWSSHLTRAWQTAELLGAALGVQIEECEELGIGASLSAVSRLMSVRPAPEHLMLVGHEPDMGLLFSSLSGEPSFSFQMGAIGCLSGEFGRRTMNQEWYVTARDLLGK